MSQFTRRSLLLATTASFSAVAADRSTREFELTRTEEEWKSILTPEQYRVLRRHGTERAGTSPLNLEKRKGTFLCAGCNLPLYSSQVKYDSKTGWPSFWEAIKGSVGTSTGPVILHDAHRGSLSALRRTSRAHLRRRSPAHRQAPLHQRRGPEV